ncbi:protein SPATA31F1 isoform X2 [Peromyscus eremicus]|uniref:protein SPATA31F1 isoform X2 n=1 Tax=Peromyscus eremicus TaxID=42410 RepID=UPI0027DE6060|nr:protein SPATA31F1 isoform X2 [Peromyscus eremicus]
MLSSACSLWDIGYPLCTYSSIFIIFLIAWQIRRSYQGLSLEPKKSCCRRHRKVRQRARDAASRARRLSREEAEKPWELLTIMKSQSWLPKEEHVRQLLCVDPCCHICDAASLEIQQLLQSERTQTSPALSGLPPGSSCLEMLPISRVSFEQNVEHRPRHSRRLPPASGTPILAHLTEHLTQSTSAVAVRQCWADHPQLDQKFPLADMPMISETMASSRIKEPVVLMIEEKLTQNESKFDQESQDRHHLKSSVSLLPLNPKTTNLTHTMSLHMSSVLPSQVPLLSPKVRRILELHVKKWIHFQKWGLPRRVEESLKQLMPDRTLLCQSRKNTLSSILSSGSEITMDRTGTISCQTNRLYLTDQPTQTCWVSEWSFINLKQRKPWQQICTYLSSHELEHLSGFYPPRKAQANDTESNLQSDYRGQLFCGLPSLHSESLDVTSLSSQGVSKNISKSSSMDCQPTRELSLPFLPKTPCKSVPSSSSASPNAKTPHEQERAQISVPFLTLAECEALECHLLERQVKLQWGLPAVFLRKRYTWSHTLCEPHSKAKTIKTYWPRKPFSYPTREFSFPEHVHRLLEFHLQKQLIHLRWGLPQRIQRSIHSLLSSTDQQFQSCSSRALPNVSIPQPGHPEADGSGDMFALAVDKGSISTPRLFSQTKAMLKNHIDSKCGQIHQGKVPAQVWSSWERKIPGTLAVVTPFSSIPQGQHLELQAESKSNPDLHRKVVPLEPGAFDQEKRASSGTLVEHCKRPHALSKEMIKKLETTLQHKYLAFLSGLPALYCVALSRPISPTVTSQPRTTEMMSRPVKSSPDPRTQLTSLEGPFEPCTRDDKEASVDTTGEVQPDVQMEGRTEKVPLDSQTHDSARSLNSHILAKLNFHLKKKVLAMQFGISEKEREDKEPALTSPESESMQEPVRSLGIPEGTELQKLPGSSDSPPAPDANRVHLKKQPATAGQPVCHKPSQPSSRTVPHGSAQWGSKASKFRNKMESQVYCIQMETSGDEPSLEKPFSTEPQGKSKSSAHVPTLTEKSEEPGKPKAVGDLGERDADLGLSPTSEKTHHDGDEEPEKGPLHRTPQGSSQQRQSSHLENSRLPSPQEPPDLEFPEPPPKVLVEREPEHDMQDSQAKVNVSPKPAKVAKVPQPVASQASRGLPFPRPPTQGKPFGGQTRQDHISEGQVMPISPHASPSLPEAGLKTKMKSFFYAINPKIKGKTHVEPMVSIPGKAAKTSKENVDKGLPQAKSPTKKTKTENCRGPKAQSVPSEKSVIASFLTAPHISDSKLRPGPRQFGSVSAPGRPRHCPRHCPQLAYAIQYRNPP